MPGNTRDRWALGPRAVVHYNDHAGCRMRPGRAGAGVPLRRVQTGFNGRRFIPEAGNITRLDHIRALVGARLTFKP